MPGSIIVENDNVRVDHWPAQRGVSKLLAFTFMERQRTPARFAATLDGNGFGGDLLLRSGFDVICFKPRRDDWYQTVSEADLDRVNAYVAGVGREYAARVGYGSSMGAYAAVQFAGRRGLDRVLALSPLVDFSGWDIRFSGDLTGIPLRWTIDPATVAPHCMHYCVYDPYNDDRRHMDLLATVLPPTTLTHIALPLSGHPSMFFLAQTGLLASTCLCVLRDGAAPDAAPFFERRRTSAQGHFALAQMCLLRGKYRFGLRVVDRAIKLEPRNVNLHLLRVRLLVQSEQSRAALGTARQILDAFPGEPAIRSELAELVRRKRT